MQIGMGAAAGRLSLIEWVDAHKPQTELAVPGCLDEKLVEEQVGNVRLIGIGDGQEVRTVFVHPDLATRWALDEIPGRIVMASEQHGKISFLHIPCRGRLPDLSPQDRERKDRMATKLASHRKASGASSGHGVLHFVKPNNSVPFPSNRTLAKAL
jgi:hypothetical protein